MSFIKKFGTFAKSTKNLIILYTIICIFGIYGMLSINGVMSSINNYTIPLKYLAQLDDYIIKFYYSAKPIDKVFVDKNIAEFIEISNNQSINNMVIYTFDTIMIDNIYNKQKQIDTLNEDIYNAKKHILNNGVDANKMLLLVSLFKVENNKFFEIIPTLCDEINVLQNMILHRNVLINILDNQKMLLKRQSSTLFYSVTELSIENNSRVMTIINIVMVILLVVICLLVMLVINTIVKLNDSDSNFIYIEKNTPRKS